MVICAQFDSSGGTVSFMRSSILRATGQPFPEAAFLTKSRRYSVTFAMLRDERVMFRRAEPGGPERAEPVAEPTTLVVNFLAFVGAGWQTPADAMLATTSAATVAAVRQELYRPALDVGAGCGLRLGEIFGLSPDDLGDGWLTVRRQAKRVGGIAEPLAREIQKRTGKESRSMVLGHLQRGGMPTGYDRLLASRFGGAAVRAIADEKWGHMVALQSPHIVTIPITEVLAETKRVDPSHDTVMTARATGISFGD